MKTKKVRLIKSLVIVLSFICVIVLYYFPFETDKQCGESSLCCIDPLNNRT